jgi:cell filamentation protein
VTENEDRVAAQKLREQLEADLVQNRIRQLHANPVQGNFDTDHLKAVHAYIFQDLPHHRPGVTRDDTAETWIKHRALENSRAAYDVPYVSQGVEAKISAALKQFGGPETIKGLTEDAAAQRIAQLYGDLDHAHGFYEGNSRTLREFTRELADAAGFQLDWVHSGVGTKERNALYVARDLAVLERAYPDLTPEKAMQTNDLAEYEASFVLDGLRQSVGNNTLAAIICDGLGPIQHEHAQEYEDAVAVTVTSSALFVFNKVTGAVESLVDFVCDFLAGGKPLFSPAQFDQIDQIRAQRKAEAALENIRESIERGENLKAEDIEHLNPAHLENIKSKGDAYLLELIERMERTQARERDNVRERER